MHPHHGDTNPGPIQVAVVNFPEQRVLPLRTKLRNSSFRTQPLAAGIESQILSHAVNRKRAWLTVVGAATDVVYLCGSSGDAQRFTGAVIPANTQPVELTGVDEVWAICTTGTASVGIIAEYEVST